MRPGFRRAAIVLFVILLPIAAHSLWDYIELRRLVREIEAISAKKEPVTEFQAGRGYPDLTPEQELAGRSFMAGAVLGYPVVSPRGNRSQPSDISKVLERVFAPRSAKFDLTASREALSRVAAEGTEALQLADRAVTLPFVGYPPGTSYNYRASEIWGLMGLLSARTASRALAGDGDGAVASLITSIKARPSLEATWPFRQSDLDTAVVLSFSTPSAEALRRLRDELAAQEAPDLLERQVIGDRASFIDRTFRRFYGGDPRAPHDYRLPFKSWGESFWRPAFTRRLVTVLQHWNRLIEASRLPWPEKGRQMEAIYAAAGRPSGGRLTFDTSSMNPWWYPRDMFYAVTLTPGRTYHHLAVDRCSVAAIAIALYRADHEGRLPRRLSELTPQYLAAVPQDPATGNELLFSFDDESYTVYSTGPDGKDNGGDLASVLQRAEQQGWGRRQIQGNDIGVRVLTRPPVEKERAK